MTRAEYEKNIELLNYYTKLYDEGRPIISDLEWDNLYFDCIAFEEETGYISEKSPSSTIQFDVKTTLKKVKHNHPMLSLAKTKDINDIEKFISNKSPIAMAKLDGLTCSLLYKNGKLVSAETKGKNEFGEDITANALCVKNIPKTIDYKEDLIIDGEMLCTYSDFATVDREFKTARSYAAGSIRLHDSKESGRRKLSFICWDIITDIADTLHEKLEIAQKLGFDIVPYCTISGSDSIENDIIPFLKKASNDYPIDGIVFKEDNVKKYNSGGLTSHHPRNAIAYKFYDEEYESELIDIEWQVGRTGVITPVAIFKPVEIDGTEVRKASLHNLTILNNILGTPYKGQKVWVVKKNMIIPQIVRAEKQH